MASLLPHSSIMEYIDSLRLTGDEQVNIYLSAEHRKSFDYPTPGHMYEFSVPVEVNGKQVSGKGFPLAQVFQASELGEYGTRQLQVQELRNLLREERWCRLERLLEPIFYPDIPARLEPSMSSNSILYVFSGFVDLAAELAAVVPQVTVVGREINDHLLTQLHSRTQGTFQGYRIRVADDLDLLRETKRWARMN